MRMPGSSLNPVQRRARIAALIAEQNVWSQQELAALLRRREGVTVTQATLSRDLAELGVVKGPRGYMLPGMPSETEPSAREAAMATALRHHFISAACGGAMVVVRTPPGHANSLAVELDRSGLPGLLGTIAGDDTIFLATCDADHAQELARTLTRLARSQAASRSKSVA